MAKNKLQNYPEMFNLLNNIKEYNQQEWESFWLEINMRDSIRKTSIFDVLPEFKNYAKTI
jgi:hypothetical protein